MIERLVVFAYIPLWTMVEMSLNHCSHSYIVLFLYNKRVMITQEMWVQKIAQEKGGVSLPFVKFRLSHLEF